MERFKNIQLGGHLPAQRNRGRRPERLVSRLKSVKPGVGILRCFLWILFSVAAIYGSAQADEVGSGKINWAYQRSLGEGFTISTSDNLTIYKLPISYTLDAPRDDGWAVKIGLPIAVGVYGIEVADQNASLDVMSIVPGVEFQIPVADNWTLTPLVNFGLGKDTSGGGLRYLYSVGIKHQVVFLRRRVDVTLGNTLRYDGYSTEGNGGSGYEPSFSAGLDFRSPLGFNLFNKPGLFSLYGIYLHYFDGVTLNYAGKTNLEIDNQYELGLTLSTIPSWKIWRIPIKRVGIGYRFGDGFSSVRMVFGMPF